MHVEQDFGLLACILYSSNLNNFPPNMNIIYNYTGLTMPIYIV